MPKTITIERAEEHIFHLRIDDAANENRLSEELCSELMAGLSELAVEPELKVLILSGRKDVFCAGATLQALQQIARGDAAVKDLLLPGQILNFPAPIIAAVEGHAVGGGLVLALCCDLLVASESSRYGMNFTSLGFTPGMGATGLLPALVGHQFASEMFLTAKYYKGRELKNRGLFNYVVPAAEVWTVTLDLARRMAGKPKHVLEMVKNALALPRCLALQQAVSREHLMHEVCFSHPETAAIIAETYLR